MHNSLGLDPAVTAILSFPDEAFGLQGLLCAYSWCDWQSEVRCGPEIHGSELRFYLS